MIRIPIERELDLHAFAPREIAAVVSDYVDAAADLGLDQVRLIHGRGRGVQRGIVQAALDRHPRVAEFWDDTHAHLGATCARLVITFLLSWLAAPRALAQVPTPESHFGFRMGADRKLATADQIESYFERVSKASDRVRLLDLGATTEGHRTLAALVTSPTNMANLDQIRSANQRLADARTLTPDEALRVASSQKVVVAIGASIHASEIGATQAASDLLYALVTASDQRTLRILDDVITIVIPMLNPDGHRLVTDWYSRGVGTPYEGGPMPWLYHKYAGHDVNRDAFMMNLAESRNLARFFYQSWHPQVFLTLHQMEQNGPRFFVPPNTDPIDLNYDPLMWRSAALLGDAMAMELQRDGRSGVVSSAKYDYYWPGFEDSAPLGHNTVCLLAEVASANVATPITVPRADLRGGFRGLPEYRPQINFPDPWPGGLWTLRDIVDYNLSAVRGLLTAASAYRETLVQNFYTMGRRAVDAGRRGGPYAYLVPPGQFDALASKKLESLLLDAGVDIQRALEPFVVGDESYPEGTDIIFLAQPYRAYVKTLFERQQYPEEPAEGNARPNRPYDVAGWTLPAQLGVRTVTIDAPFEAPATSTVDRVSVPPARVWGERRPTYWILDARANAGTIALNRLVRAGATPFWTTGPIDNSGIPVGPGALVVPYLKTLEPVVAALARDLGVRVDGAKGKLPPQASLPAGQARVGVYRPWMDNIDEGWTRWVLDQHEFAFDSVDNGAMRAGNLRARYDVIVLPSVPPERLIGGISSDVMPSPYSGGLSIAGVEALRAFVEQGGRLVCLGLSSSFAVSTFALPIRDVARENSDRVFVPGSLLRVDIDPAQPLGFGLPRQAAAFMAFGSAFSEEGGASVPVRYASRDLLVSGWLEGETVLAGRAAVVDVAVGQGRVVLLGFSSHHRGQPHATFRIFFNALQTTPPAPVPKVSPAARTRR